MTLLNNRYKVLQVLGDGGFGRTFLAEDTQMPSLRRCVIKQLIPITGNPQIYQLVQERFQREAAILEELGDANNQIPQLYAYFTEQGQFYLVQEWIPGQTLSYKLQQSGILSETAVRELLLTLLPVLAYVHGKRMVHRDIKPSNIILRMGDGKPVLIDFGAVKETMATEMTVPGHSHQSIVIGTPGYMPSEQSAGLPVYASDLYSLGLTAIYLLTGKEPAALETNPQNGSKVWRQYASNISPSFANILDRAIQPHWRDRYPSAQAMLDALLREQGEQGKQGEQGERRAGGDEEQAKTLVPATKHSASPAAPPPHVVVGTPASSASPAAPPPFLLGSLIVGGVVGASVIIGLFLTKSPQSIVEQSTSPTQSQTSQATDASKPIPTSQSSTQATIASNPTLTPATQPVVKPHTTFPATPTISSTDLTPANDFSWLSEKVARDADLTGRSAFELDILRNSIYARHGRRFKNETLQNYFNNQPWYRPVYSPDEFPDSLISPLEQQNAAYILEYQNRHGLRWAQ